MTYTVELEVHVAVALFGLAVLTEDRTDDEQRALEVLAGELDPRRRP